MSRAFTKERDDAPEPLLVTERPEPHPVTPAGRAALSRAVAEAQDARRRAALEARLETAVLAEPPPDRGVVAFGATVAVRAPGSKTQSFTIVGAEEADVARGKIGASSPLAVALLGARVGDTVVWHRPVGDRALEVRAISYEALAAGDDATPA